jgi:hypothetical protein
MTPSAIGRETWKEAEKGLGDRKAGTQKKNRMY